MISVTFDNSLRDGQFFLVLSKFLKNVIPSTENFSMSTEKNSVHKKWECTMKYYFAKEGLPKQYIIYDRENKNWGILRWISII
jgi:hypothetical protein